MLKEFDKHPVTAEIRAGPRALDYSGATDGYGNLYAFLGFEEGSHPITELRDLLETGTQFRQTAFRNNTWYFRIQAPSKKAIEDITEMDWGSGDSWVNAVEKGLDNITMFIYKKKYGRSKAGFQAAYEVNEDLEFKAQPYLTEIMSNFRNRINNSRTNDV